MDDDKLDKNDKKDDPNTNNDYSIDNKMRRDQAAWNNNINVSNGVTIYEHNLDNQNYNDNDSDDVSEDCSDDSITEVAPRTQLLPYILGALGLNKFDINLDELA